HAEFAGLTFRIVASLDFLEQFAVIVKKYRVAAQNDLPERGHGKMGLARAARPHQQESRIGAHWIIAGECFRDQLGLLEGLVPLGILRAIFSVIKFGIEVVEVAVFIAVWKARASHRTRDSVL